MLCAERGIEFGQASSAAKQHGTESATIADLAQELGVAERTARHRVAQANAYEALPKAQRKAVDSGEKTLKQATAEHKQSRRPGAHPAPGSGGTRNRMIEYRRKTVSHGGGDRMPSQLHRGKTMVVADTDTPEREGTVLVQSHDSPMVLDMVTKKDHRAYA